MCPLDVMFAKCNTRECVYTVMEKWNESGHIIPKIIY